MDNFTKAVRKLQTMPPSKFKMELHDLWLHPVTSYDDAGILFNFCCPESEQGNNFGCLTQVKNGSAEAFTPELTEAIRNDPALPTTVGDITQDVLPRFAYWQRKMAKLWKKMGLT